MQVERALVGVDAASRPAHRALREHAVARAVDEYLRFDLLPQLTRELPPADASKSTERCVARDGRYIPVGFTDDDQNGMTGRPLRMASIGNFSIVGVLGAWVDDLDPAKAPTA